jgi:hypothetical protein
MNNGALPIGYIIFTAGVTLLVWGSALLGLIPIR